MSARTWSEEESRLRTAICRVGKLSYDRSYIVGADGNISAHAVAALNRISADVVARGRSAHFTYFPRVGLR